MFIENKRNNSSFLFLLFLVNAQRPDIGREINAIKAEMEIVLNWVFCEEKFEQLIRVECLVEWKSFSFPLNFEKTFKFHLIYVFFET